MIGLILKNASTLATPCGSELKKGSEMDDIRIIENGCVITKGDTIEAVGGPEILKGIDESEYQVIDLEGKTLLPGLVDSHTHFIFGGYREDEFSWRLKGDTYVSIMERGGGIKATTDATRKASYDELYEIGRKRLESFAHYGVTTVEGKSGYGLDLETELTQLRVMKKLNQDSHMRIVPTYMGAHDIPSEYKGRNMEYLKFCVEKVMPAVREENLAVFSDIFTEKGVFDLKETEYYLKEAEKLGFRLKMHADELNEGFGASELAGELKCVSADHLLKISDKGMEALRDNGVCATVLPLTAFSIKSPYAKAREMIDKGLGVALATDMNPGSCYSESMPLLIALSSIYMGMTVNEIVTALTLNGACAAGVSDITGSIEKGKKADFAVFGVPNHRFLNYHFGVNECVMTIASGKVIYEKQGVIKQK